MDLTEADSIFSHVCMMSRSLQDEDTRFVLPTGEIRRTIAID